METRGEGRELEKYQLLSLSSEKKRDGVTDFGRSGGGGEGERIRENLQRVPLHHYFRRKKEKNPSSYFRHQERKKKKGRSMSYSCSLCQRSIREEEKIRSA